MDSHRGFHSLPLSLPLPLCRSLSTSVSLFFPHFLLLLQSLSPSLYLSSSLSFPPVILPRSLSLLINYFQLFLSLSLRHSHTLFFSLLLWRGLSLSLSLSVFLSLSLYLSLSVSRLPLAILIFLYVSSFDSLSLSLSLFQFLLSFSLYLCLYLTVPVCVCLCVSLSLFLSVSNFSRTPFLIVLSLKKTTSSRYFTYVCQAQLQNDKSDWTFASNKTLP